MLNCFKGEGKRSTDIISKVLRRKLKWKSNGVREYLGYLKLTLKIKIPKKEKNQKYWYVILFKINLSFTCRII